MNEHLLWYMEHEHAQEQNRRRNQNLLDRQLFERAKGRGYISIHPDGSVDVLDVGGTVDNFRQHPNLVAMCPMLARALSGDTARLAESLTEIWRQVSAFRG